MDASAKADRKRDRRIAMMRRRAAHLEQRIAENPHRNLSYDKAEASALRWAIGELEQNNEPKGLAQ
jgi:hypothetical protein